MYYKDAAEKAQIIETHVKTLMHYLKEFSIELDHWHRWYTIQSDNPAEGTEEGYTIAVL